MFFYEGSPLGTKKSPKGGASKGANPRLRSIPLHAERPSITEIKRLHSILSTIEIEEDSHEDQDNNPRSVHIIPPINISWDIHTLVIKVCRILPVKAMTHCKNMLTPHLVRTQIQMHLEFSLKGSQTIHNWSTHCALPLTLFLFWI